MIDAALRARVEAAMGARIATARERGGGSIARAFDVELEGGERVFLKAHAALPALAMQREAEGLEWLREADAVRVPRVRAFATEGAAFLVLERVDTSGHARADEDAFGRELAALHRAGAPSFGLAADNFLAVLPQDNTAATDWAAFYRARRIEPLVRRARERGLVDAVLGRRIDALLARMESLVGPAEPPARLHGDLWGGNRVVDAAGRSWIVDPAVYGGHREMDLAMMRLFGGFGSRAFAAYDEAFALAPGASERVALHQLYPVLAHVVMFGASYVGELRERVAAYS
jgi:fructosamine-3-kinase